MLRTQYRQELDRLEGSRAFARSAGQVKLLRFLLEAAEGAQDEVLKETYIGTVFYGRSATYDPQDDSIVRVNVNRLRQRLLEYYAEEGAGNPVRISIPRGVYSPVFTPVSVAPMESAKETQHSYSVAIPFATTHPPAETVANLAAKAEDPAPAPLKGSRSRTRVWGWIEVAACLLLVVGLAFQFRTRIAQLYQRVFHPQPAFVNATLRQVPLTMGREQEFEPNTTADGKDLAYVSRLTDSSRFQIFLRPAGDGGQPDQPLETGPENALYPAWSPDGKQIAFLRCGMGPCDIATISAKGGAVRSVHNLPRYTMPDDQPYYQYRQLNPVWTADGGSLIYPYRGENDDAERLVTQNLTTGTVTTVTSGHPSEEDAAPALSPDGGTVAFLRRRLSWTQVMTIDLKTHATKALETEPNVATSGVTWSRDGKGLVVGLNRRKGWALLWVPLYGPIKSLDVKMPVVMNPVFAGDGKSLMALAVNRSRDLSEVIGANGTPVPVFRSRQRNAAVAFSPDKKQVAFLSDRSGLMEVWLAPRVGHEFVEPRQLTHGLPWYPISLVWSPDGEMLAVAISNTNQIEMVDARTGVMGQLRLPGMEHSVVLSPVWSADGRSIYFSARGEKNGIFRAVVGPIPAVTQILSGHPGELRVDGDRALIFQPGYGRGLYRVAIDGASAAEPLPGLENVLSSKALLVEKGKLYHIDAHSQDRRLREYDLTTHADVPLTQPLPRVVFEYGTIAYDPTETLLIYSAWAESAGAQIVSLRWGK